MLKESEPGSQPTDVSVVGNGVSTTEGVSVVGNRGQHSLRDGEEGVLFLTCPGVLTSSAGSLGLAVAPGAFPVFRDL